MNTELPEWRKKLVVDQRRRTLEMPADGHLDRLHWTQEKKWFLGAAVDMGLDEGDVLLGLPADWNSMPEIRIGDIYWLSLGDAHTQIDASECVFIVSLYDNIEIEDRETARGSLPFVERLKIFEVVRPTGTGGRYRPADLADALEALDRRLHGVKNQRALKLSSHYRAAEWPVSPDDLLLNWPMP